MSTDLSRRRLLSLVGGGTILAATVGTAVFLGTRRPARALAPWGLAGSYGEVRRNALSWALLAPSPHNRQPWLAELQGNDTVLIWRDPDRDLPHTDPDARQLTIGMGCFLELMVQAAAQQGHGVDLSLYPQGESGPVAKARFLPGAAQPDPLFAGVADRRSCKEPFDGRALPRAEAAALAAYAAIVTDPERVATLRALTREAWEIELQTPRTWKESVDLLRIGKAEIEANPDGIDLSGPLFDTLGPLGLMPKDGMLDPDSMAVRQTRERYRAIMEATPAYALLTTGGNTRADQIAAGRRWVRLNLAATLRGVSLHPVSQCLQEYPEMSGPYARIHTAFAAPGETVQMLGRVGYGPDIARTPRWPLDEKLKDA